MKRILLLFSTLMLSCIALWAHDVEIDGIYYNLNETKKTARVTYRGEYYDSYDNEYSESVTIPETITNNYEIYSVTSIGDRAFYGCSGLTSVTIPNSVTFIGNYAFYGCSGLTEVTIPNSVTSIGSSAFSHCSGLTEVTIPNSVTYIGSSAFYGCSGLTSVTILNSVTSIGDGAFYGCSGLTEVTIPNSVTSIGSEAFRYCNKLTSVTIPNSVTSIGFGAFYNTGIYNNNSNWDNGVLYIDNCLIEAKSDVVKGSYTIKKGTRIIGSYAFSGCSGLTSVTIPNSVMSIGEDAFSGCSGLTKVIWNAKNCEHFGYESPFYNIRSNITSFTFGNEVEHIPQYLCYYMENLKEVTIPNSVTSIDYEAFAYCSGLTEVTIPNSVTYIGTMAFYCCSGLTSVTIPNSVTSIGSSAFSHCSGLTEVTIPNSVTSIGSSAFSFCSGLTSVTIGNSVTSIGSSAFKGCSGLTSVTIPNSVTSIGEDAFYNCSGLTSVTIPNSVTYIRSGAFSGCSGLTKVIWNAKNCEDFKYYSYDGISTSPFYDIRSSITSFTFGNEVEHIPAYLCYEMSKLSEVTIPNSVTSIGEYAFSGCSRLTSVTIPNSVTSIGEDAFYNCRGLRKVNYLGTVDKWVEFDFNDYDSNPTYYAKDLYLNNKLLTDVKITTADSIKDYAFYNCQSIKSVEIGNSVTSIGEKAFEDCSDLTSITIGESVTYIGYEAFSGCSGLTEVTIPNSVTSIGYEAFAYCSGLTSVSIGNSVTSIGSNAFSGCDKLKKVTAYPTTVPNAYESSFAHYNAALYVPCDIYEDYDLDDVFGSFKYIKCIAAEEVDAPEKVEIEVDEDNNANVIWPSTDGAKKYELEISKDGEVFCTLLFNENGQLTSIDFGNRSASVGFQFTVTGLDSASKYAYSMVAMDKKGNELQSYKGTFTTNGYVPGSGEEDEPSAIIETLADANITVSGGTISADADFSIYNTIGQDVTSFNGSLQPGIYVVALGEDRVKIMIK